MLLVARRGGAYLVTGGTVVVVRRFGVLLQCAAIVEGLVANFALDMRHDGC